MVRKCIFAAMTKITSKTERKRCALCSIRTNEWMNAYVAFVRAKGTRQTTRHRYSHLNCCTHTSMHPFSVDKLCTPQNYCLCAACNVSNHSILHTNELNVVQFVWFAPLLTFKMLFIVWTWYRIKIRRRKKTFRRTMVTQ